MSETRAVALRGPVELKLLPMGGGGTLQRSGLVRPGQAWTRQDVCEEGWPATVQMPAAVYFF